MERFGRKPFGTPAQSSEPPALAVACSRPVARRRPPRPQPARSRPPARGCCSSARSRATPGSTDHPVRGGRRTAGDWILVAPGDYHENADTTGAAVGVRLHGRFRRRVHRQVEHPSARHEPQRGDRRRDQAGRARRAARRPSRPGPTAHVGTDGKAEGRNGILVWKANGVSVDNLTVCNFLAGSAASGNEIWWNGGAASARSACSGYSGRYLTATSTFFGGERHRRAVRDLLVELRGTRGVDQRLREQLQRLRHVRGRLPAGRATSRSTTPGWNTARSATPARTPAARS